MASQNAMLERLGEPPTPIGDARLGEILEAQLEDTRRHLEAEPCFEWIEVDFGELVRTPHAVLRGIAAFLSLDASISSLAACIDEDLHRERAAP